MGHRFWVPLHLERWLRHYAAPYRLERCTLHGGGLCQAQHRWKERRLVVDVSIPVFVCWLGSEEGSGWGMWENSTTVLKSSALLQE